jgi:hypothetical protein
MRTVVIVLAVLGTLCFTSIHARADGAWCAHYVNRPTNCGFNSYAQCVADVAGNGHCAPNPAAQAPKSRGQDSRYLQRRDRQR